MVTEIIMENEERIRINEKHEELMKKIKSSKNWFIKVDTDNGYVYINIQKILFF